MHWYVDVLKKYAVFSGRARRQEYWMFTLFSLIISIVLTILDNALDINFLAGIYALAVLVPSLAVGVRRLHDTSRSGWWLLLVLIPFVGAIVLIVFFAIEGKPEANEYGPNPKHAPAV
ncbi:DUF805 domain-containing protein [Streptomyces bauhiniae]|uniref:DUF805 domain-containing protein n=1 Tax=Streptomyces bauhiniae TaxID=2340725 RepID=A0A7K3QW67_9ACTN|nr:DUF805 domain-containing protein [Streptomyces bauhiniae]NEB94120.1 DUF805 domain-containing protein [Streptomyces bauhiniae]